MSLRIPDLFSQIETVINSNEIKYEKSERNNGITEIVNDAFFVAMESILHVISSNSEIYTSWMNDEKLDKHT